MPYGLIPWGNGNWGLPTSPPIPIPPQSSDIHIINVIPSPGSYNIARNQTFTFTIKTNFFALNTNNTYIFLDNQTVVNGSTISSNFTVIASTNTDGISMDYTITPNYLFKDADIFTLQVYATDIYGTPSFPFWAGYVVVDTRPSLITPIYPLDGYADVPIDLTLHFLVNQLAAPGVGLDSSTLNINVDNIPAVIGGVIQSNFSGIYSAINLPETNDVVTPFEILLDYSGRYSTDDIITVSATAVSIVVPIIDSNSLFLNPYGQQATDAYGTILPSFSITRALKLSDNEYQLTLLFSVSSSLFESGSSGIIEFGYGIQNLIQDNFITDGYKVQNENGNVFSIVEIIDNFNVIVEVVPKIYRDSFTFITAKFDVALVTPVFAGYFQGVYLVDNLGDGYHINITWHPARTTRPDYDLAYLIYYSTTRSDVFYEQPKLITQGRRLPPPETIPGADAQLFGFFAEITLPVGVSYYFGVRATEFPHSTLPLVPSDGYSSLSAGLIAVDGYSFSVPRPQVLMNTLSGAGMLSIPVMSVAGFAVAGGYISVGCEIMRYSSLITITLDGPLNVPGFSVPSVGRGLFGTTIQNNHNIGEIIQMYYGNQDDNTVIAKNLVSWEEPHDPHRTRPDLVTTDFTLEDGYHTGFEFFDYCGYHRFRPDELLDDSDSCGTYVGGEYGGHRGLFIFDRMLANEEQLLEVTGEPIILLRRLWSGETCICRTSRKDSSKVRSCAICFGTGFKCGFVQYLNPRRDDQKVMVHFAPSDEDLGVGPQSGLDQKFKPGTWTIAVPAIKDRDVIVRFNEFGEMDWIYIVNSVSRAKSMFGRYSRQKLLLSRLDKTDVMYTFKIMV